ncbi:MAG: phosphopentomutase [Alicyclobacillaceae bacterium]|nr:phosphopentomutase [Alicyclobacillaceae bacterium]
MRWIWIVLDSCGIGGAPDAERYGDEGANTLGHIAEAVGGLRVPHLARLGLSRIVSLHAEEPSQVVGCYGRMRERSVGKDTTNGHWEFVGVILDRPLPVYPNGFPPEIIEPFEQAIGRKVLGNRPASGTEILKELGDEHIRTGRPIVYTSGDSVFQIAAHEEVIPLESLYRMCEIARHLLQGDHAVGRVIARPFVGRDGRFVRTDHRRDYSLRFGRTVLDDLVDAGWPVVGIGKIHDIYGGYGITEKVHTKDNMDGVDRIVEWARRLDRGLIYGNLVDFDSLYGHRNDPAGFARAVEAFDARLPEILETLREDDVLVITADHGCDPTTPGTDHTRELVPLLVWGPRLRQGVDLGLRETFADVGATLAEAFGVPKPPVGTSFWSEVCI